jgi:predicted ATPase
MIRHVDLKNFKCHKNTRLKFSNLTVLCGANNSGKSSVIQALLLLRNSFFNKFDYLNLKSNLVNIGTAKDALYQFSEEDKISFKINTDNQNLQFGFTIKDTTKTLIAKSTHSVDFEKIEKESLFNKNCQFISATRLGPQVSYPKNDTMDINNQISNEEGKCENVVQFLDKKRYDDVISEICVPLYDKDLFTQVTVWEREISSGINIIVKDIGNLGYELKYQLNTNTSAGRTDEFNALNVGVGLTYALPVIVAILSAPKEALLLIENPEAHLHPHGQAKLAELIAWAAQAGIQIVIETHSDHIVNGILVQCKNFESGTKGIDKRNVKLFYFGEKDERQAIRVEEIKILEGGKIDKQPTGFFDQIQHDLKIILGF